MPLEVQARPPEPTSVLPGQDPDAAHPPIRIGLVNNMPDSALEGTEAQFCELLEAAAGPRRVKLCFSYLPEVERGDAAGQRLKEAYWPIDELLSVPLDALIVTGAEPRAPSLREERYWDHLVEVLQWAERHTSSSVWSCLAAHAAVLELDGIERRPLPRKCCGVFGHTLEAHPLTAALAGPMPIPHSRWNDLEPAQLAEAGYAILARSSESGAGIFVKERGDSLLVFVHGHPEYDERALLKEYQRDVGRFLSREQAHYPTLPAHYFSDDVLDRMEAFREMVTADPDPGHLEAFPFTEAAACLARSWGEPGVRFYRNWLAYLAAERDAADFRGDLSFAS
jgi:homoserine O-succinyltransferase/O-acetyltransferase